MQMNCPKGFEKHWGVVNKNDLNHIFGKPGHHLGAFMKSFGGNQASAYYWVQNSINRVKLPNGVFKDISVKVNGYTIYVNGRVINGVKHIGTFFIKK